mmetsp:Transcript_4521/g.10590  ORF Transcript_4521/g.10590 Transcript_4521/m.10590 type:complete len:345 (+) Transcript_4521:2468-3502(+)
MGLISLMVELGVAWAVTMAACNMPPRPCCPSFIAISSQNMAVPPHCSSTRSFSSPAVPKGASSSQGSMVILLLCSFVSLWMGSGAGCSVVGTPAATARRPMNLATREEASSRRDSPKSMSLKSAVMASSIAADSGNPTKSLTSFPVTAASTAGSRRTIATFNAPRVIRADFTLPPSRTAQTAPFMRHFALRGRRATRWESKTPVGISNSTETKNSPAAGDSVNHLLIGVVFSVFTVASRASNIGHTSEGKRPSSPLPTRVAHTLPPTVARFRTWNPEIILRCRTMAWAHSPFSPSRKQASSSSVTDAPTTILLPFFSTARSWGTREMSTTGGGASRDPTGHIGP